MRHLLVSIGVGALMCAGAVGQHIDPPVGSSRVPTCDTIYVGPPGGSVYNPLNWTQGLPRAGDVACFPDDQRRVGSVNPPDTGGLVSAGIEVRIIPSTREQTGGSDYPPYRAGGSVNVPASMYNSPPPTATGSCCLGSTCVQTDAFDCRELGGYFLAGVGPCTEYVCATGACCNQDAACVDDDGGGGPMDEELCDIMGGSYLGGALCDTDPCQRFRIPQGFEIIEVTPGMEPLKRRQPRMNNCGQIVVQIGSEASSWEAEIYLYDNGLLTQVTNDGLANVFPDINDQCTITWNRRIDPETRQVVVLREGDLTPLGSGPESCSPRINNLDHVVWDVHTSGSCQVSAYKCDIYFYDGNVAVEVCDDGFSNQTAVINNYDQMAWTRYSFPCSGFEGWTSEKILYSEGVPMVLPSAVDTPQSGDIDNHPRVAWGSFDLVEVWQDGQTTALTDGHIPGLNDRGDIAYSFKTTYTPWQLWLYRDGQFSRISSDMDIENLIHNSRPDINDDGEIAWWWNPNSGLSPAGTRFMRRIRNGDVDFDGDRDLDDFIPMPNCWTGPVPTDGLCECRFLDIDHDRDIDHDDFDLFMRVYTGPLEDCNQNEIVDLYDLIDGPSTDCNLNGIPDECDIESGFSQDIDGDGVPDECIAPIPAVSEWGLIALTLLLLAGGSILLTRRRAALPA